MKEPTFTRNTRVTAITEEFTRGRQSVDLQCLYRTKRGTRLKVQIKYDNSNAQSYARLCVWSKSELQWNPVHCIPYQKMHAIAVKDRTLNEKDFSTDVETLINVAFEVIGE